jgi:hypothetical protein
MGYMKRIATERIFNPTLAGDDSEHKAMRETVRRLEAERKSLTSQTGAGGNVPVKPLVRPTLDEG